MEFQFTHPGRGATVQEAIANFELKFQFTHPGRGATISVPYYPLLYLRFQFTHPGRGATVSKMALTEVTRVSIHAPREGCDQASSKESRGQS